jgi:hypothetical protein
MDVRLARKFEQGSMKNSVNFPLYQPIAGWGVAANIRRAGFAFFGMFGTERNKEWLSQVEALVPKSVIPPVTTRSSCSSGCNRTMMAAMVMVAVHR